jgi:hypothetical protein
MQPWFIATETFSPKSGKAWERYLKWSGLHQLDELVTLDLGLCPTVLKKIKDNYWPHIVNEDFLLEYFVDLDFLVNEISGVVDRNLLCVFRNPADPPSCDTGSINFEFLGYDLCDVEVGTSALSNCGGFPDVFSSDELSCKGLLTSHARALEVQKQLRLTHPEEPHANCHCWAIFRAPRV